MKAIMKKCLLNGIAEAPPSKSMVHRYLIGAALSGQKCRLDGVDYSEDILASIDCLRALGAGVTVNGGEVLVDPKGFLKVEEAVLNCRESGSTLRFFIPLALTLGKRVTLKGSDRLFQRPLDVYETLCRDRGFLFEKKKNALSVCGKLTCGRYRLRGDVSSQFITGLIFALLSVDGDSTIEILPPFESRSYVDLTISALRSFGATVSFVGEYEIAVRHTSLSSFSGKMEGDYSNAAFLDAFNYLGSSVTVQNLNPDSLQGDRVYREYFKKIQEGTPTLDLSDCPDLGPILFALAAFKNGATFTGTDRLKAKESDRGAAMHEELQKLGGGLVFGDNQIIVPKQELRDCGVILDGHNDHRIVMAMSVVLTQTGGAIQGVEAVKKSFPHFFDLIGKLGAKVELL